MCNRARMLHEPETLWGSAAKLLGEMWFQVTDQPIFPVASFWQRTEDGNGFNMVTCDPNSLVEPIHLKAMIAILEPEAVDTSLHGTYKEVVALQRFCDSAKMTVRGPISPNEN